MSILKENDFIYYVDEEKGVIAAKCPYAAAELMQEFARLMQKFEITVDNDFLGKITIKDNYINFCYLMEKLTGKSKCNIKAGDIFDINLGKELARTRLIEKIAAYRQSFYEEFYNQFLNITKNLKKRVDGNNRIRVNAAAKASILINGEVE